MSISHRARRAWTSVCLVPSAIFCKLKNEGSWGATLLRQILLQIGEKTFTETFQMLQQANGNIWTFFYLYVSILYFTLKWVSKMRDDDDHDDVCDDHEGRNEKGEGF